MTLTFVDSVQRTRASFSVPILRRHRDVPQPETAPIPYIPYCNVSVLSHYARSRSCSVGDDACNVPHSRYVLFLSHAFDNNNARHSRYVINAVPYNPRGVAARSGRRGADPYRKRYASLLYLIISYVTGGASPSPTIDVARGFVGECLGAPVAGLFCYRKQ